MKKIIVSLLVIILIAAVGVSGWYLWDSLQKEKNKTIELENEIIKIKEEFKNDQKSKDDVSNETEVNKTAIENTQITNEVKNTEENSKNNNITKTEKLNEQDALVNVNQLYNRINKMYNGSWQFNNIEKEEDGYNVVDCKYLDYYKEFMTEEQFNNYLEYFNIEKRENKYYCSTGYGADPTFISDKIVKVKNIEPNRITAEVEAKYEVVDGDFSNDVDGDKYIEKYYNFIIIRKNNTDNWIISDYTCPAY